MKSVLVTGASGFIGRQLCRRLVEQGCTVRGISLRAQSVPDVEMFQADLASTNLDSELFRNVDTVFHLAGKAHALSETRADNAEYSRINTEGTRRVVEAAKKSGVRRLIFFSSVKAMSNDESEKTLNRNCALSEENDVEPDTPYGKSKREAEKLVLGSDSVSDPTVLRLCMVYGPQARGNVTKLIEAVRAGHFPPLPELGNKRSMVHVEDVVQAAILAASHPKGVRQVFVVSDGRTYSTREMYEMICQALGRKVPDWTMPMPAMRGLALIGDGIGAVRGKRFQFDSDALEKLTGSAWFSSEKIQRELGYKPEWTFERALPAMVEELVHANSHSKAN